MLWKPTPSPNNQKVKILQEALQVPQTIASLLVQRHITTYEAAKNFFRPQWDALHDPFLMRDMFSAVDRIENSVMKSLVVTDSIEADNSILACKNIRIVPTAPMFAQAILNIWNGTSVSSLFDVGTLGPIYDGHY